MIDTVLRNKWIRLKRLRSRPEIRGILNVPIPCLQCAVPVDHRDKTGMVPFNPVVSNYISKFIIHIGLAVDQFLHVPNCPVQSREDRSSYNRVTNIKFFDFIELRNTPDVMIVQSMPGADAQTKFISRIRH